MRIIRTEKNFPDCNWTKFLSSHGQMRAVRCETASLAQELVDRHGLNGAAAFKLVETIVAAVLNSSLHDDGEDINVRLEDAQTRLRAVVDARPEGAVRGMVSFLPDTASAKSSLAMIFTQNREGQSPYFGITESTAVHIDENLDNYFRQSAQIATSTGISIEMEGRRVKSANGMLIQIIGGASARDAELVLNADKQRLRELALRFDKKFGENLVGVSFREIETRALSTFCTCSQEKLEDALKMSEPGENEPPTIEAFCDFCRKQYVIATAKIWP